MKNKVSTIKGGHLIFDNPMSIDKFFNMLATASCKATNFQGLYSLSYSEYAGLQSMLHPQYNEYALHQKLEYLVLLLLYIHGYDRYHRL